jgi:hypothetical protein
MSGVNSPSHATTRANARARDRNHPAGDGGVGEADVIETRSFFEFQTSILSGCAAPRARSVGLFRRHPTTDITAFLQDRHTLYDDRTPVRGSANPHDPAGGGGLSANL